MKPAIVHEFLITWGGSDLVVQKFCEIFPEAPIYTALFDKKQIGSRFEDKEVLTSFLQKIPWSIKKHRMMMPFFPLAFEAFDLNDYDLILSSHHMSAKSVVIPANSCHISYVHTPMRYAWDHYHQYMSGFGRFTQVPMRLLFHYLRMHDVVSANRVDYFIANSRNTARRIKKHYRRDSVVINAPVQTKRFSIAEKYDDYYLVVSRLVPYKRIDLAVQAFNKLDEKLVIIGSGPETDRLKSMAEGNVEFLGFVPDEEITDYYSKCKAFIFPGEEDFGITPLEAQASGRPVIAYGSGGALETVIDGKTGIHFSDQTPDSLVEAVRSFDEDKFDPKAIRANAELFDEEIFKDKICSFVTGKYAEWLEAGN